MEMLSISGLGTRRNMTVSGHPQPPEPGQLLRAGRAAQLLRCSARTVAGWIDGGILKGYRLPNSRDRRVHTDDLIEFMLSNGMFRSLGQCTVADGGILYRARLHERWGRPVGRVAPPDAPAGSGVDWEPGLDTPYVLKACTPEVFQQLMIGRFRFEDGR